MQLKHEEEQQKEENSAEVSNQLRPPRSVVYPYDIHKEISTWLPVSDKARLASSSFSFYAYDEYKEGESSFNTCIQDKNLKIEKLVTHVVRGQQAEAEEMIKVDPGLLLEKWRVVDYSGRTIEGTPLQIALGAEDVKFHEDEECMAEMIERYLVVLPDGENKKSQQILEQFPAGWEAQEALTANSDLVALDKIVYAIEKSNRNYEFEDDIQIFEAYLEKQKRSVIKTGKHFNNKLLAEAFKLFKEKFDSFGRYNSRKNNLFWCRIIGTIQRYLPACYAQAFCQGIIDPFNNRLKLNRSLQFKDLPCALFYPLDSDPCFCLGVNYAMAIGQGSGRTLMGNGFLLLVENFSQLCEEKNTHIFNAYTAARQCRPESMVFANVKF